MDRIRARQLRAKVTQIEKKEARDWSLDPPHTSTRLAGSMAEATAKASAEDDGKGTSAKMVSAGSLILLQIFSRFLTLFMTQMQVRLTSAEVLGVANIHFELMLGLILTLSREGFRTALSRTKGSDQGVGSARSTRNVTLLPVPIGVCISVVVLYAYTTYLAPPQMTQHPHFTWAIGNFTAGAVLELIAEPLYIDALMAVDTRTRVMAEGLAVAAKSASTLFSLWYFDSISSLLPFGIGQFCFGAVFLTVFWVSYARKRGLQEAIYFLVPSTGTSTEQGPVFNEEALHLSWTMTRQNIFKHGLGEGDKLAVAKLASLSHQGAYALASNYGSLIARLLYQPLEESSRLTFAHLLGDNDTPGSSSLRLAADLLQNLLAFHILLSLFLITFCPPFSTTLLLILAGRHWAIETSASSILATYGSTYLPAMAFNGLLEGFLQACATPTQLTRYAFVLVAASGLFVSILTAFQYTSVVSAERGLILASSLSTLARAAYSFHFTLSYFHDRQRKSLKGDKSIASRGDAPRLSALTLLPHSITVSTFLLSAITVRWRSHISKNAIGEQLPFAHIITGLTCASLCVGAW
ncbi:hypothetical protein CBS101457_002296 [Exobasidium rhododendri]|nr:hypothetical protein CBS101457_002296 [Exobasidium rhododendri]